jgi:hypothetical protein
MVDRLARGICAIEGQRLVAEPDLSVIAFTSDIVPVPALAAAMERRGWFVNWGGQPEAIHLGMVTMAFSPRHGLLRRATVAQRGRGTTGA